MIADPSWKSALLHKGQDVEEMLDALLRGHPINFSAVGAPPVPGQDPEGRLRAFLEQIERAIDAFDSDRFGRCSVCNTELDRAALAQEPWLCACPAHAARWTS
jgi:hypothetical protein